MIKIALTAVLIMLGAALCFAQNSQQVYENQIKIDINAKLIDRMDVKQGQVDHHLEATDDKLHELSSEVATIKGIGAAAIAILSVLKLLGFLKIDTKPNAVAAG